MPNNIKPLIIALLAFAGLFFAYAIIYAGNQSIHGHKEMDPLLSSAAIIIGGILSTNLGAVLGVTLVPPKAALGAALALHHVKFLGLRSSIRSNASVFAAAPTSPTVSSSQKLQIIACWLYLLGLVTATVFRFIAVSKGYQETDIVPLIPELSKTLLGVIAGAVTVSLGK